MKKFAFIALLLFLSPLIFLSSQVLAASPDAEGKKPLVAFFSRSGNTEALADMIHKIVGGDMVRIETVTPYPADYQATVDLAKEQQKDNARPPISTKINADDYDVIFLGFPNWWSSMPMPVWTFIEENKLNGKTIIPFMTHGGGGQAHAISDLKKLCPQSKILPALAVSGTHAKSAAGEVEKWLKDLAPALNQAKS